MAWYIDATLLPEYHTNRMLCININIHIDTYNNSNAKRLAKLLELFECKQHLKSHMNRQRPQNVHLISSSPWARPKSALCESVRCCRTTLAILKVDVKRLKLEQLWMMSRSWRKLSLSSLEAYLNASRLCTDMSSLQGMSVNDLARQRDNFMRQRRLTCSTSMAQLSRYVASSVRWLFSSMPNVAISEIATFKNAWEAISTNKIWHRQAGVGTATEDDACIPYIKKRTINIGGLRLLRAKVTWRNWWTLLGIMEEEMVKAEDNSHTANDFANFFADKVEAVQLSTSTVQLQNIPHMDIYLTHFQRLHLSRSRRWMMLLKERHVNWIMPRRGSRKNFACCHHHSLQSSSMSHLQWAASHSSTNMQSACLWWRRAIWMRVSLKVKDLSQIFYHFCWRC